MNINSCSSTCQRSVSKTHRFLGFHLGIHENGQLRYVGHPGTGFSDPQLINFLKKVTSSFTEICSLLPPPKSRRTGPVGRTLVSLRGRISGVEERRQNERDKLSWAAGR
jgi:hypothetical protein